MVLPLTTSDLLTFAKAWSQRACSHMVLGRSWQDCDSRGSVEQWLKSSQLWGLEQPDGSAAVGRRHRPRCLCTEAPLSQ